MSNRRKRAPRTPHAGGPNDQMVLADVSKDTKVELRGAFFPGLGAAFRKTDVGALTGRRMLCLVPRGEARVIDVGEPNRVTYLSGPATVALLAAVPGGAGLVHAGDLLEEVAAKCGLEAMCSTAHAAGVLVRQMERHELGIPDEARLVVADSPTQIEKTLQVMARYDRAAEFLGFVLDDAAPRLETK